MKLLLNIDLGYSLPVDCPRDDGIRNKVLWTACVEVITKQGLRLRIGLIESIVIAGN